MNKKEYTLWLAVTNSKANRWKLDTVTKHNSGDLLFYKGTSARGEFLRFDKSGMFSMGNYRMAYPHIGEALFITTNGRKYGSQEEALEYVKANSGIEGLDDHLEM